MKNQMPQTKFSHLTYLYTITCHGSHLNKIRSLSVCGDLMVIEITSSVLFIQCHKHLNASNDSEWERETKL